MRGLLIAVILGLAVPASAGSADDITLGMAIAQARKCKLDYNREAVAAEIKSKGVDMAQVNMIVMGLMSDDALDEILDCEATKIWLKDIKAID